MSAGSIFRTFFRVRTVWGIKSPTTMGGMPVNNLPLYIVVFLLKGKE